MGELKPGTRPYLGILAGVTAVSFAAIFIRLSQAHPLAVAFYRMALAALVFLPLVVSRGWSQLASLRRAALARAFLAGLFLGIHMGVWVSSLYHTSVASSVILVSTQSVFAVLLSHFGIREKVSRGVLLAVLIALVGSVLVGGSDLRLGRETLAGDGLALAGAFMAALYITTGRTVRRELPLLPYVFLVYSTAAVFLGICCLAFRVRMTGYSGQTYLWLILLALVPTVMGHTLFNWSLRYLRAYVIGVSLLGEPIGATVLAYFVFGEVPAPLKFVGGVMVLAGIYLLARKERGVVEAVG